MIDAIIKCGELFVDLLLPTDCLGCDVTVRASRGFCDGCASRISVAPPGSLYGVPVLAPYRYTGPVSVAIRRLKYESCPESAGRLVRATFPLNAPDLFKGAWLLPVPAHPSRLIERGYNQAGLLARALGSRWKQRVVYQALRRSVVAKRQVGLGRDERRRNVEGAFVGDRRAIAGQKIILVDDVVTTGATCSSCIVAVEQAGASVVAVVAVARAASLGSAS